jgi:hypothetical protein
MKCKNCLNFLNGQCKENKEQSNPEGSCSIWSEDLIKTNADEMKLNRIYYKLIEVLKTYCDLKSEYYPIIALWIIGTYNHENFPTYPYLFFNAMRGSGKSRILNLISKLSYNGKLVSNMSESVLFRTAKDRTLCIDEFEEIGSKEKATLRELLNSAYKRGMCVERTIKKKGKDGERYDIESFDVYCPIVMANINGVEDVLSDRCITLILDRSTNMGITRLIELFDEEPLILSIKEEFGVGCVVSDGLKTLKEWNAYTKSYITDTTDTTHTYHTDNPTHTTDTENKYTFFDKIIKTNLEGRNLELFFPLLLLAEESKVLDEVIPIVEGITKTKKEEDFTESRDVAFLNFISGRTSDNIFVSIKKLVEEFSLMEEGDTWVTAEWIGKALKRLDLILEKKRFHSGRGVIINYNKAKEKLRVFQ